MNTNEIPIILGPVGFPCTVRIMPTIQPIPEQRIQINQSTAVKSADSVTTFAFTPLAFGALKGFDESGPMGMLIDQPSVLDC
jgi:hypothetical protein